MVSVRVKLELGHSAIVRQTPTSSGMTHNWNLFIRGLDSDCSHYIQKVVFHLHESFPKPKREIRKPPFEISEHGYGSFNLQIEIYFRNRGDPDKILYNYDLFLRQDMLPVKNLRFETLTFTNPNNDFKQLLLLAKGELIQNNKVPAITEEIKIKQNKKKNTEHIESSDEQVDDDKHRISKKGKHRKRKHSKDNHKKNDKKSTHKSKSSKKDDNNEQNGESTSSKGGLAMLLADYKDNEDPMVSPLSNSSPNLNTSTKRNLESKSSSSHSVKSKERSHKSSKHKNDSKRYEYKSDSSKRSKHKSDKQSSSSKHSNSHKSHKKSHKSNSKSHHKSKKHRSSSSSMTTPSSGEHRINEFHIPTTPVMSVTPPIPQKIKSSPATPKSISPKTEPPIRKPSPIKSNGHSGTTPIYAPTNNNAITIQNGSSTKSVVSNRNKTTPNKNNNKNTTTITSNTKKNTTPTPNHSTTTTPPPNGESFTPIKESSHKTPITTTCQSTKIKKSDPLKYLSPINGHPFSTLISLQRKLFKIASSDISVLRNISLVVRKANKNANSKDTLEFDLCNMDYATINKISTLLID